MTAPLLTAWQALRSAREQPLTSWRDTARPEQLPLAKPRRITYLRGGRGSGKTWAASNTFAEWLIANPGGEWGVVAPTFSDARSTAVESQHSGLLKALGTSRTEVEAGQSRQVKSWNRSHGELVLRNGAIVYCTGADNGAVRLQGKNLRGVWGDEIGLWDRWETAWDESIRMATRMQGSRIIATGTPKATRRAAKLVRRLISDSKVDNRLLRTIDNSANLSDEFLADVTGGLTGRLRRQELEGELLDEPESALWKIDRIDELRVEAAPPLVYVVVAVDPAVTAEEDSDETGIVVVGKGRDGHGYVLADLSLRGTPDAVSQRVCSAFDTWRANFVVAETNNGGDWIGALIHGRDPNVAYRKVTATRGKYIRAEPISALYEQGRMHHVGQFHDLEQQMCQFEPGTGDSPDRMDALVWGAVSCNIQGAGMSWADVYNPATKGADPVRGDNPWADAYGKGSS